MEYKIVSIMRTYMSKLYKFLVILGILLLIIGIVAELIYERGI